MLMLACGKVKRRERACNLYSRGGGGGVKCPCYQTASPPMPLPLYGGGAANVCVRIVPLHLPPPFWHSLHLLEISVVFTALYTLARPTFTALHVCTVHPKFLLKQWALLVHRLHIHWMHCAPPQLNSPTSLSLGNFLGFSAPLSTSSSRKPYKHFKLLKTKPQAATKPKPRQQRRGSMRNCFA